MGGGGGGGGGGGEGGCMKGSFLDRSSRCSDWESIQARHRILPRLGPQPYVSNALSILFC